MITAHRLTLVLAAAAGLVFVAGRLAPAAFDFVPRVVPDFGVYWAAAAVNARGDNPYAGPALENAQRDIDPKFPPIRANSGPWTLAVLTPFTAVPYEPARLAWFLLETAVLVWCGGALWRLYGGDPANDVGWLLAVSGYAGMQSLTLGQLSPLVLLGCVGFTLAERRNRDWLAGLCLALLLVKPQNQLVVMAVGAVWLIDRRRWAVLGGAAAGACTLSLMAAAGNPTTFAQYSTAMRAAPPVDWMPPLPATLLRLAFGWERYWLTFLPLIPGTAWALWHYARHRRTWGWADRLPLLLIVSYLSSPYGWAYDQLVFLFPLIQWAARTGRTTAALGLNLALTVYYFALLNLRVPEFHWVWVPFAALAVYGMWLRARSASEGGDRPG